jgi:branched-chain amino acid aminotransferase
MISMAIHSHFLHNGELKKSSEPSLNPGQIGLLSGWGVFTTLRVVDGVPFAWERHWARMSRDARLLNVAMPPDPDPVLAGLFRLIEANAAVNSTLRLAVVRNTGGIWQGASSSAPSDFIALTAPSRSWGESVRLAIQPAGRYAAGEFTSAKILSWAPNLCWVERAQQQGFDEVILLNEHGRAAECTSANIFAVFGDRIVTPPVAEGCLPGITREVLLEEVHVPGLHLAEAALTLDDLYRAGEVLITSTTRGLLPVREIAGRTLNRGHDAGSRLSAAFQAFFASDIAHRKSAAIPA